MLLLYFMKVKLIALDFNLQLDCSLNLRFVFNDIVYHDE